MNWKLEAREKLQSYPTRRASCDSLKNELRRLEYEAEGLKSPTLGESVQLSHSAQDDRIVTNLVHRKELSSGCGRRSCGWKRWTAHCRR